VRCAGQAGVIGADRDLDVVQHAFGDLSTARRCFSATSSTARFIASLLWVVETIRLHIGDLVVLVDLVVVEQRAARRLDDADAFARGARPCHEVRALQIGSFRSSRIFSMQCTTSIMRAQWLASDQVVRHAVGGADELLPPASASGVSMKSRVHARQRADAVPALSGPRS
jgi:hypothetical protein